MVNYKNKVKLSDRSCNNNRLRAVAFDANCIGFHHYSGYWNCDSDSDLTSKHFPSPHEVVSLFMSMTHMC